MRSSAAIRGSTSPSATIASSDGPARPSIPTNPATWRLASVTYTLPGPTIRSTDGIDSVPYAIAATAWAPPVLATSVAPARFAAYRTAAWIDPSRWGGVHTTISSTPATLAGTTVIATVDGYFARPPGT